MKKNVKEKAADFFNISLFFGAILITGFFGALLFEIYGHNIIDNKKKEIRKVNQRINGLEQTVIEMQITDTIPKLNKKATD